MIGELLNRLKDAETKAAKIIADAQKKATEIEAETQREIEKLKNAGHEISVHAESVAVPQSSSASDVSLTSKVGDVKPGDTDKAIKFVVSEFNKRYAS